MGSKRRLREKPSKQVGKTSKVKTEKEDTKKPPKDESSKEVGKKKRRLIKEPSKQVKGKGKKDQEIKEPPVDEEIWEAHIREDTSPTAYDEELWKFLYSHTEDNLAIGDSLVGNFHELYNMLIYSSKVMNIFKRKWQISQALLKKTQ